MSTFGTTRMSSKGQVVLPENIRKKMNLEAGANFVVVAENDVVILKIIQEPSTSEFNSLIRKARKFAKEAGLTPSDVECTIKEVRKSKQ